MNDDAHIFTRCIHGGQKNCEVTGAVMPPIYTSSTYAQESPGVHKGYEYSRSHNLTRYSFERAVASLENTGLTEEQDASHGGFAFSSGLAATAEHAPNLRVHVAVRDVLLDHVEGGDHAELEHLLEVLLGAATEGVERIAGDPVRRHRVVALRVQLRLHLRQHLLDEAAHRRDAKDVLFLAFSGSVGALGEGLGVRAAHGCSILASLLGTLWLWERK